MRNVRMGPRYGEMEDELPATSSSDGKEKATLGLERRVHRDEDKCAE